MMKSIREKNQEQDFRDLENGVRHMQDFLRSDESYPDLYDQFSFRTDIGGCHRYFVEPYKSTFGSMLERGPFIPFPAEIMQKYERTECASFMGILPEINRVWITIDNYLYLWNYYKPEEYQLYDGISEVIVSVAITVPKPGIFLESVKYLLIVATPVDIVILAICSDDTFNNLKIIPTAYTLPSDNITMIKIVGSELGRIFMIGNDRNLYELEYTISESPWAPILGSQPQRKCRKINHFAWNFKLNNLLPPIFRTNSNYLRDNLDDFSDLLIDNTRNILYTITNGGELNAVYLNPNGKQGNSSSSSAIEFFLNGFNLFDECRRYATTARFSPQSSPNASVFNDTISSDGFIPVGLYPISLTESKKVHLLVILKNGIRVYLSLIGYRHGFEQAPRGIEVSYMRNPPSSEVIEQVSRTGANAGSTGPNSGSQNTSSFNGYNDLENGSLPSVNLTRQFSIGKTFASRGVFLFSFEANQQPDQLFGIYEDVMRRDQSTNAASMNNSSLGSNPYHTHHAFSMKEGVSLALPSNISGGKIYDLKEVSSNYLNYSYSKMKSLFHQSASPAEFNVSDQTHHHWQAPMNRDTNIPNNDDNEISAVLNESNSLILRQLAKTAGIEKQNMDNFTILSELCTQHLPITSFFTQRQFLVLTSNGLQVLYKIRPSDILFRCLIQHDSRTDDYVKEFFHYYGLLPSSLMCIGLAIGLPVDACGSKFTNPIENLEFAPTVPLKTIQIRAMRAMLALNNGPSYRASISNVNPTNTTATGIQDNRLVVIGNANEFNKSVVHDAFYSMTSRLLRMIWYRPVVDKRSSRILSDIWSPYLIQQVRKPLEFLLELLVSYYPNALSPDLINSLATLTGQQRQQQQGLGGRNGATNASHDPLTSGINFITQQLAEQYYAQQRINQSQQAAANNVAPGSLIPGNNSAGVVDDKILRYQSKLLEDISIYYLILLIVRVLNGLSLIETLQLAANEYSYSGFYDLLKGYSFRSFILLPNLQLLIKKELNRIITTFIYGTDFAKEDNNRNMIPNPASTPTAPKLELSNALLSKYEKELFSYYSMGDIYVMEAKKIIMKIYYEGHYLPDPSTGLFNNPEIMKLIELCCSYYLKAADYWNNNYDLILNLSPTDSVLKNACSSLLLLGKLGYETIVNLCLKMAQKFSPTSISSASASSSSGRRSMIDSSVLNSGSTSITSNDILSILKDFNLFHGGILLTENMKADYLKLSYQILIQQILHMDTNLRSIYQSNDLIKFPMNYHKQISSLLLHFTLSQCSDIKFHELLYNDLYNNKLNDLLLSINSNYIESFLKQQNPELLYTYYMNGLDYGRQPDYLKAIDLMCGLASDANDVLISYRIQCIEKALTSAEFALNSSNNSSNNTPNHLTPLKFGAKTTHNLLMGNNNQSMESYLLDNIQQFKDMIEVAKYQERIAKSLEDDFNRYDYPNAKDRYDEKTLRELERIQDNLQKLKYQLLNITTLYELSLTYRMWDYNLLILQLSKQNEMEIIMKLWKSFIYRLVPMKAKNPEILQFLESQRRDSSKMFIDSRNQESKYLFEEYQQWLPALFHQILVLGKEILANENKSISTPTTNLSSSANNASSAMGFFSPTGANHSMNVNSIHTPNNLKNSNTNNNNNGSYFMENSPYFPLLMIIEEMEELLSFIRLENTLLSSSQQIMEFRQHYSFGYQLISHLSLSSSVIIEYYFLIFNHWITKTYDKQLQLLMIIIYLLLEWIRKTNDEVNGNQLNEENWYCITMIRQGKLDKWLEKLRSQLLSFQYRQIKESFTPFIEQLMLEMNQIQKYKENLTIYTKSSNSQRQ